MTFGNAIGVGIGVMVGVLIFIAVIIILVNLMRRKKGDFTVEMFEDYKREIISEERYEEVIVVDTIIKSLNDNKPDKKLLSNYEIDTKPELILKTKDDDETSIRMKSNSRIISKARKNRNKK